MSAGFTDNLATLGRAARLLLIQQEARTRGARITLGQAARVLEIYEAWLAGADPALPISMRLRVVPVQAREREATS